MIFYAPLVFLDTRREAAPVRKKKTSLIVRLREIVRAHGRSVEQYGDAPLEGEKILRTALFATAKDMAGGRRAQDNEWWSSSTRSIDTIFHPSGFSQFVTDFYRCKRELYMKSSGKSGSSDESRASESLISFRSDRESPYCKSRDHLRHLASPIAKHVRCK